MFTYLKNVGLEFKRIKWVKGKEMARTMLIVLVVSAIFSVIVLGLDAGFSFIR